MIHTDLRNRMEEAGYNIYFKVKRAYLKIAWTETRREAKKVIKDLKKEDKKKYGRFNRTWKYYIEENQCQVK